MSKPKKNRYVKYPPFVAYFKPQGVPMYSLEQVSLHVEEYEALRLSDFQGMRHNEAASEMKVSRPTFTRIINSAHKKLADAITNGKAIRVEGGNFILMDMRFFCEDCRNIWEIGNTDAIPENCPKCGSQNIVDLSHRFMHGGHNRGGFGRRHRGG